MLRTSFAAAILAGALAGSAVAQVPDAGCALPSEPEGIPAALDAASLMQDALQEIAKHSSSGLWPL
jgi:hypothetical protein